MFKKTIIFLSALLLVVGIMVMPVSAASAVTVYNPADISTDITVDGENDICTIGLPVEMMELCVSYYDGGSDRIVAEVMGANTATAKLQSEYAYTVNFGMSAVSRLLLNSIPDGTICNIDCSIIQEQSPGSVGYSTPQVWTYWTYYDADFQKIGHQSYFHEKNSIGDVTLSMPMDIPEGTCYGRFTLQFQRFLPLADGQYTFVFNSCEMKFSVSSLFLSQQATDKTNALMNRVEMKLESQGQTLKEVLSQQEQTNDMLEELPGNIGDEMQGIIDKENQQASSAGDGAAGDIIDILPNESQGFMNAVKSLVSSMSYNGTNAKLPIPPIDFPNIPGVVEGFRLLDQQEVDFGYWVQQLPSSVLTLVQILCTIALIVYCFKELYSMIAYVITLRGGGNSE